MVRSPRWTTVMLALTSLATCHVNSRIAIAADIPVQRVIPAHERNPVIVIPGVLGSRLIDEQNGEVVWGKYDQIHLLRRRLANLRSIVLPMKLGAALHELRDTVRSDGTLAHLKVRVFGIPVELEAYQQILATLSVGGYVDESRNASVSSPYGSDHFTCFQFDYDWRRDISENAVLLDRFIKAKRDYIQREYAKRYGVENVEVKFDIVAHSLGGLLSRYYLRYGAQALPDDGSLPTLNWEGAANLRKVVLVGTPNAGSVDAFRDLIDGYQLSRFLPYYSPAAIGTMPSIYQLLPRPRHGTLVDARTGEALDFYNPELWRKLEWGLADPDEGQAIQEILPDVPDPMDRSCIALDHQAKCLQRARQFHDAIDLPASPPAGVSLHLYAGDAEETPAVMSADFKTGELQLAGSARGDDTTTIQSAIMLESSLRESDFQHRSPIQWTSVELLGARHRKLTRDAGFTSSLLQLLTE